MNFISYQTFVEDCKKFIETLPKFSKVSYIPRSGMIPAFMYSKRYNIPLVSLEESDKETIVFDDSIRSGNTLQKVREISPESKYAFIYYIGNPNIDFKYKEIDLPRLFEWNWINQEHIINHSCFDFDGVLCHFPKEDLDSGKLKYKDYLKIAKPKYIPDYEIGAICTARIESDRKETENWLKKHNVKYKKLIMLNSTKEERIMFRLHTIPKIKEYSKSDYVLFVEDEFYQAILISQKTKKPVLNISDMKIY